MQSGHSYRIQTLAVRDGLHAPLPSAQLALNWQALGAAQWERARRLTHTLKGVAGENLPLPGDNRGAASGPALDWGELLVFVLFAGPMVAAMLRQVLGNKLGSLVAGAGVGALAWWLTALWWVAVGYGLHYVVEGVRAWLS